MLYLEDILEVIENVPQEIRDRTTELRELDLSIQNAHDQLEDQVKNFFGNAKKMKPQERDAIFERIRKDYYKLLDDADEKVDVATNMHDSLERYTRKLDQELEKFKYELEADSPGITEILEKRSLELDEPVKENQKENHYHHQYGNSRSSSSSSDWRALPSSGLVKKEESLDAQFGPGLSSSPPTSSLSYTLGQIGAGSNAIAAAASQAIAATQQLQQGRRSASLKASYDAITHGVHASEFSIGSELATAAQTALAASALTQDTVGVATHSVTAPKAASSSSSASTNKRQKKKHSSTPAPSSDHAPMVPTPAADDTLTDANAIESPDWTYDPNEPRYCVCNQVSYGDMVACDNPRCLVEWFHYPCVDITEPPKGKWFCPPCATSMNRRQKK
ncbi:Inhibitor of growth protein N-terminal histone-binding [Trinorchestia longiramus]|nr:Inhibitor of growth protein N-terminal histone-binding [Trinorchestia longiramus]